MNECDYNQMYKISCPNECDEKLKLDNPKEYDRIRRERNDKEIMEKERMEKERMEKEKIGNWKDKMERSEREQKVGMNTENISRNMIDDNMRNRIEEYELREREMRNKIEKCEFNEKIMSNRIVDYELKEKVTRENEERERIYAWKEKVARENEMRMR